MLVLSEKRKEEVREELERAYKFFGVKDENEINKRIEDKMEWIYPGEEKTIELAGKTLVGFHLSVAVSDEDNEEQTTFNGVECIKEKLATIVLAVNERTIGYLLKETDCYSTTSGEDIAYGDSIYKVITLEQIQEKFIPL